MTTTVTTATATTIPALMGAMTINRYGGPEVFERRQVAVPEPGPRGVLVRIIAEAVNPADTFIRGGRFRLFFRPRFPLILGSDVAGEVVAAGSAVSRFRPGDAVYAMRASFQGGGYAAYVVVDKDEAAHKPRSLTFAEAAAAPLAALTALQGLRDQGEVRQGQRVAINGASGGVGTFAVQLAKAFGAEVTAICSEPNRELVRSLGADHTVDYRQTDFTRAEGRYDTIFDVAGQRGFRRCRPALSPTGRYVTTAPTPPNAALQFVTKRMSGRQVRTFLVRPSGTDLEELGRLFDTGQLRSVIDRAYPLDDVAAAHERSATGRTRGKLVLTVDAERADER